MRLSGSECGGDGGSGRGRGNPHEKGLVELSAEPVGSAPGFRRPVVVVQGDHLNRSKIATVICVPLTRNLGWADAPGNVLLSAKLTGLSKDSVANVSQLVVVDKTQLEEHVGRLPRRKLELVLSGIDVVLGR